MTTTPVQPSVVVHADVGSLAPRPAASPEPSSSDRPNAALPAPPAPHPPPRPLLTRTGLLLWLIGLAVCMGWDRAAWLAVSVAGTPRLAWIESTQPWSSLAKIPYLFGQMYVWTALALLLVVRDWTRPDTARVLHALRRAVFVFLVPASAGLAAELLKVIVRRYRPEVGDGFYRFKPLDAGLFNGDNLGMASSHAAVAVAAALAAGLLYPRARPWLLLLAALCVFSRVALGAHYLSDVYVGAALGLLAFRAVYAWDRHNNRGIPIDAPPLGRA